MVVRVGVPAAAKGTGVLLEMRDTTQAGTRREPQPHQQRCRQRSRRAEPGRAFDEGAEEVADDNGLDAWVRGDGLEAAADDVHEPGFFQSVLEEDGSRHDEQQVHRLQDAVDGVSRRVQGGDLPDEVHQQDGEQEGDAH